MITCETLATELFPEKWKYTNLTNETVKEFLDKKIRTKNLKTKSMLGHKYWTQAKLQQLITTESKAINETWNLQEEGKNLLMWENNRSHVSAPDAIMSFDIIVGEKTRTNKAASIFIYNHLMWVTPKKRKQNLGHHLVVHFLNYLLKCNINSSLISQRGIEVIYNADFDSEGGECLSKHISQYLAYMQNVWTIDRCNLGWPIKRLEIAVEY